MRSVASHGGPGLLLFDEPSASLDPTAEQGGCLCTVPVASCSRINHSLHNRFI